MQDELNYKTAGSGKGMGLIIAILIGAWIIGMSVLGAGYLISKEVAKNYAINNVNTEPLPIGPIDIEVPAGVPVLGDNNAKVTIVEFADFQCPFCGQWHKEIFPQLKKEYIDTGKARFIFMDFAFLGEESSKAAEAARCAQDQGKFWEYHDELLANQKGENEGAFNDSNLKKFASQIKLDMAKFNACFDARVNKPLLEESTTKASNYGVTSTPSVYINGNLLEGLMPFNSYKQIIETELDK